VGEPRRRDRRLLHGGLQRCDDGQHQRCEHDRANGHADGADHIFRAPLEAAGVEAAAARRRSGAFVESGFCAHLGPRSRMGSPGEIRLQHGAEEDDHREDERQRRAVAELQVRERIQIHPEDRRGRLVERLASGHQEELVECEQRPDDAEERDEQHCTRSERQHDPPHALPVAGPVRHRRLLDVLGDRLDGGDEEEHAEANHFPHDRYDHRPKCAIGVPAEPHDGLVDDAEVHQSLVDEAVMVAEQPVPEEARDAKPDHHRNEYHRARKFPQGRVGRDEERDQVAEDHQDRCDVDGVFEREAERYPELPIVPSLHEIGNADPFRRLDDRPIVKRHPDHLDERVRCEHGDEDHQRRQVQQSQHLPACRRVHLGLSFAPVRAVISLALSKDRGAIDRRGHPGI
jgi:hypothetical protein